MFVLGCVDHLFQSIWQDRVVEVCDYCQIPKSSLVNNLDELLIWILLCRLIVVTLLLSRLKDHHIIAFACRLEPHACHRLESCLLLLSVKGIHSLDLQRLI